MRGSSGRFGIDRSDAWLAPGNRDRMNRCWRNQKADRKRQMSAIAVEEILERIRQLPAEDRILLEQRLGELAEAEWRKEAEQARQRAQAIGIDQAAIDRAISELRHS
jgi:hypothetical protein